MSENLPDHYLTPEQLQAKLLLSGLYSAETLPPAAVLTELMTTLKNRINLWFGFSLLPQEQYTKRRSKHNGCLVLPHYPVIKITQIKAVIPGFIPSGNIANLPDKQLSAYTMQVGQNAIQTYYPKTMYEIWYISGYDPLPEGLEGLSDAIFALAVAALQKGGLGFLNEQVGYLTNVSMRNLSQTFTFPGASEAAKSQPGGQTELDKMLAPFARFRKKIHY